MTKTVKKISRFVAVPMIMVMLAASCAFAAPQGRPGGFGGPGGNGGPARIQPMGGGHGPAMRPDDRRPEPGRDWGRGPSHDSNGSSLGAGIIGAIVGGLLVSAISNAASNSSYSSSNRYYYDNGYDYDDYYSYDNDYDNHN
jgi:hypothetical protein